MGLILSYTWRFALYGVIMGGVFGAALGTLMLSGTPEAAWGLAYGALFGGGFGLGMGIGTGIVLGIIAQTFFFEHSGPAYRGTLVIGAFVTASLIGLVLVKLVLFGSGSSNDWGMIMLMASAGGIGAAIAGYRISGRKSRTIFAPSVESSG